MWPLAAHAQQAKVWRIGLLRASPPPQRELDAFRRALAESRSLTAEQHRHVDAALGYAYAQSGQHQQAAAYFEKALAAWPRQDVGAR